MVYVMKILIYCNTLGLGGTEKAACFWAVALMERGHEVIFMYREDGPRRLWIENKGVRAVALPDKEQAVAALVDRYGCDVVQIHAPGNANPDGRLFGRALLNLSKRPPVLQTNVFGRLENTEEDAWTDFRMFISWMSCVQAAERAHIKLDAGFFRRASVAVYPLPSVSSFDRDCVEEYRACLGYVSGDVVFGRLARPDMAKWDELILDAFRLAARKNNQIRLLLRSAPDSVAARIRESALCSRIRVLPPTSDEMELRLTLESMDVVLHTSRFGESFGYGIAEPMLLGKPVLTNATPWGDQTQIELVRHGECGYLASHPGSMAQKMLMLADDAALRRQMGEAAARHIMDVADPVRSVDRLEMCLQALSSGKDNPFADSDLPESLRIRALLRGHAWGETFPEKLRLRAQYIAKRVGL
jgi:glycosyltransferase involved in cell wall biosynthesis